MANICNNKFYLQTENKEQFNSMLRKLEELFKNYLDGDFNYMDDEGPLFSAEGWFDSKWTFPKDLFEDIIVGEDTYFRCLSEEYGCDYVAMNIYCDGWADEQTFDL